MKSNLRLLLIVAVISLVTLFNWSGLAQKPVSPKVVKVEWEHRIASSIAGDNPAELSRLGTEGWELVSVRTEEKFTGNFKRTEVVYYLKRAKQAQK